MSSGWLAEHTLAAPLLPPKVNVFNYEKVTSYISAGEIVYMTVYTATTLKI